MTKKRVRTFSNEKLSAMRKIYVQSPAGELELTADGKGLCSLAFGKTEKYASVSEEETPVLVKAKEELREYFAGKRRQFEVPLSLHGTEFQLRDWQALLTIPYGETRSYGEIARQIGCPKGSRAVGMANRSNPIAIIIPCHRVIGADGSLTGYMGQNKSLDIKEYLLKLEGAL